MLTWACFSLVDLLLNPCNCKSIWKCKCRKELQPSTHSTADVKTLTENGLVTLARAAAMCCNEGSPKLHNLSSTNLLSAILDPGKMSAVISKRHGSRPSTPSNSPYEPHRPSPSDQHIPGPSLPPIRFGSPPSSGTSHQIPAFPIIPPISTMKSLAGSGCTCGLHCACPGCIEHRGRDHASVHRVDCATGGCTTCVDWNSGIELPSTSRGPPANNPSTSNIQQFLARAAALPLPPHNRKSLQIDPMNVLVYPADLFSRDSTNVNVDHTAGNLDMKGREAAFGLIKVPKMECCGGRCVCPEGTCGCGKSCDGCCGDHGDNGEHRRSRPSTGSVNFDRRLAQEADALSITPAISSTSKAISSCCASRLAAGSWSWSYMSLFWGFI